MCAESPAEADPAKRSREQLSTQVEPKPLGEQPRKRGQQRPIGPIQSRPGHLTAQDGYLMPQHQDLHSLDRDCLRVAGRTGAPITANAHSSCRKSMRFTAYGMQEDILMVPRTANLAPFSGRRVRWGGSGVD
jgi:hypothetical protein